MPEPVSMPDIRPRPRRFSIAPALLLAAITVPFPALAADEVLVTGTRLAVEQSQLPNVATVYDQAEIEARLDTNVLDLLRSVPGVQVTQPGAGGVPQVFMRGGEPNFTVFMIDGIKVNDLNNTRGGSFDLAAINLADLERVEIVRGPQSSIYGSDGLSGVINLISKAGGGPLQLSAEAEAGSDELLRGYLQLSGAAGANGGFSLQASSRDEGEAVDGSTYESDSVSGRLRLQPALNLTTNLYARFASSDGTSFPEQSGGPEYAVLRTLDRSDSDEFSLGADADWRLSERWSVQAFASLYERDGSFDSPGIAPGDQVPPNGGSTDLQRENASLRATVQPMEAFVATVGVDYQREDGDAQGFIDAGGMLLPNDFELDRDIVGLFAEGRLSLSDDLLVLASIRRDDPDGFSTETTERIGAVYALSKSVRLRANWGTGFKLPSFFALGSPLVGNPDLEPEKSESFELGGNIDLFDGALELGATWFDNEYENLIDFDPDLFTSVNRDEVTSNGVEMTATYVASDTLRLRAHSTYTDLDVEDDGSDRELLQRPYWRTGGGVRWTPATRWLVDVDYLYVGETYDSSIPTGDVVLDSYHRIDLAVTREVTDRLRVALAIDNLLDADYEEAIGFPAPGFRPRLSVRYRFGG